MTEKMQALMDEKNRLANRIAKYAFNVQNSGAGVENFSNRFFLADLRAWAQLDAQIDAMQDSATEAQS